MILDKLRAIKAENKLTLSKWVSRHSGVLLDVHSVFDVQVKRIHEYKRQLLNVLKIISLYNDILENPNGSYTPSTFIFGGKAAPGYYMAKDIIKLIWSVGEEIRRDKRVNELLNVVYLEEYNVSMAEVLMPASDISEQISLAGKEASGTGCMKFMINGALTIGTLDGANVEMRDAVGPENIYIFGLHTEDVDALWKTGYDSRVYYHNSERLHRTIDRLSGTFAGNSFGHMVDYFLNSYGVSDPYMCLADFDSYFAEYQKMLRVYAEPEKWTRQSLINIAGAGYFAADRSIREYAENIWHISPVL